MELYIINSINKNYESKFYEYVESNDNESKSND